MRCLQENRDPQPKSSEGVDASWPMREQSAMTDDTARTIADMAIGFCVGISLIALIACDSKQGDSKQGESWLATSAKVCGEGYVRMGIPATEVCVPYKLPKRE
jgi:hypothetical protein